MQKYKLPTSHDLFQKQAVPELMLEWYEDLYEEKYDLETSLRENEGDMTTLNARLKQIEAVLDEHGGVFTGDELIDHWEAELAAGRVPDLDMMPEDLNG